MSTPDNYSTAFAIGDTAVVSVLIEWPFSETLADLDIYQQNSATGEIKRESLGDFLALLREDAGDWYVDADNFYGVGTQITVFVSRVTPKTQEWSQPDGEALSPAELIAQLDNTVRGLQEAVNPDYLLVAEQILDTLLKLPTTGTLADDDRFMVSFGGVLRALTYEDLKALVELGGFVGPLGINQGGTGATTVAGARTSLGVTETGQDDTYAYRANNLSDLADAAAARGNLGLAALAVLSTVDTAEIDNEAVTEAKLATAVQDKLNAPVGTLKAWVRFNGTGTIAIDRSANIASLTDLGAGQYHVTLTNPVAANALCLLSGKQFDDETHDLSPGFLVRQSSATTFYISTGGGSATDFEVIYFAVFE